MDGKGKFEWPDGRIYIGEYKDGKKEGMGECVYPDGRIYKGLWKEGKQDGEGMFYIPDKKVWKKGIWDKGKRVQWISGINNNEDIKLVNDN